MRLMGLSKTVSGSTGCTSLSISVEKMRSENTVLWLGVFELWNSAITARGSDGVGVMVAVSVTSGVSVTVGLSVMVGVSVILGMPVMVGVSVMVGVGG